MLSDQDFERLAGDALESVSARLGEAAGDWDFDVDLNQGALTIEFDDPRERFVASPNGPVRQIWVSAHVRSYKLDWIEARQAFVLASTGQTLEDLLVEAIRKRLPDFSLPG
jgi:CyaY protein